MNARRAEVGAVEPAEERAAAARAILVEANPTELTRAVAAVAALVGGPHCAIDGRPPNEWVLIAVEELRAEGRRLPAGPPLWVALRDRAVERIVAVRAAAAERAAATDAAVYGALERRVIARMVPQRLDADGVAVLRALCDGVTRTEQIAAALGASVGDVLAARRAIATTAQAVAAELRGAPRRGQDAAVDLRGYRSARGGDRSRARAGATGHERRRAERGRAVRGGAPIGGAPRAHPAVRVLAGCAPN